MNGPSRALSFTLNIDGSFSYIPAPDFNGVDSFAYRLFDGSRYSNVAMVTIEVIAVNDVPIAQGQTVSTNEDTPKIISLSASDIDSGNLSFRYCQRSASWLSWCSRSPLVHTSGPRLNLHGKRHLYPGRKLSWPG